MSFLPGQEEVRNTPAGFFYYPNGAQLDPGCAIPFDWRDKFPAFQTRIPVSSLVNSSSPPAVRAAAAKFPDFCDIALGDKEIGTYTPWGDTFWKEVRVFRAVFDEEGNEIDLDRFRFGLYVVAVPFLAEPVEIDVNAEAGDFHDGSSGFHSPGYTTCHPHPVVVAIWEALRMVGLAGDGFLPNEEHPLYTGVYPSGVPWWGVRGDAAVQKYGLERDSAGRVLVGSSRQPAD